MPQIQIQNDKSLFAEVQFAPLITEEGFRRLTSALPGWEKSDPALHKIAKELHELCGALAVGSAFIYPMQRNDLAAGEAPSIVLPDMPFGYALRPARGWVRVGKFIGKSPSNPPEVSGVTPEALGWIAAEAIAKREAAFAAVAQRLEIAPPDLRGAKGVFKKSANWTISAHEAADRLASAESFVIYMPLSHGFLNDKGDAAALGGARLFESAAAAKRTITSRQLASSGAVVAAVSARVTALDPIVAATRDLGPLAKALAEEEARQLRDALKAATVETLRARLAELEAQAPACAEPAKAPAAPGARKRL